MHRPQCPARSVTLQDAGYGHTAPASLACPGTCSSGIMFGIPTSRKSPNRYQEQPLSL